VALKGTPADDCYILVSLIIENELFLKYIHARSVVGTHNYIVLYYSLTVS